MKLKEAISRLDDIGGSFTHAIFDATGSGEVLSVSERVIFRFESIEDFIYKIEMLEIPSSWHKPK
jgi:hypothetical protein